MKRFFNALIFTILLLTVSIIGTASTAANADTTDKVSLYYNDINYVYHGATIQTIYIKVANIAYEKHVSVDYTFANVSRNAEAEYVTSLDNNYDIFKAVISGFGNVKYSINYTVANQTYADNNNGIFYTNEILGSAPVCALRNSGSNYVYAAIKDYGYDDKTVKIVYTTDNWDTVKETSLKPYYINGDGSKVYSVKLDGIDVYSSKFKYCISYTTNGVTYWANNFGKNYDFSYYSEY